MSGLEGAKRGTSGVGSEIRLGRHTSHPHQKGVFTPTSGRWGYDDEIVGDVTQRAMDTRSGVGTTLVGIMGGGRTNSQHIVEDSVGLVVHFFDCKANCGQATLARDVD